MFLTKIEEVKNELGSYAKVAEKIGISRVALHTILKGHSHPKEQTIISLCEYLNVDPTQMIIENEIDKSTGSVKKAWVNIEKKLASIAASILVVPALLSFFDGVQCILC